MKKRMALGCVILFLFLSACATGVQPSVQSDPSTAPSEQVTSQEVTPSVAVSAPEPDKIHAYPFTQEELQAACFAAEQYMHERAKQTGVVSLTVHRIAFDPVLTDLLATSVTDTSAEESYADWMVFYINYSTIIDGTVLPSPGGECIPEMLILRRTEDYDWKVSSSGTRGVPDEWPLTQKELDALCFKDGYLLGGYCLNGYGDYRLYAVIDGEAYYLRAKTEHGERQIEEQKCISDFAN